MKLILNLIFSFILLSNVPSFANTCGDLFAEPSQVKVEKDFVRQLLDDPTAMEKFLKNAKKSNFFFPQFKSETQRMKDELDLVPSRLKATQLNPHAQSVINARAKLLKYQIILQEKFMTNASAVRLAFAFANFMSYVVEKERERTIKIDDLSAFLKENPNVVIIKPPFQKLTWAINKHLPTFKELFLNYTDWFDTGLQQLTSIPNFRKAARKYNVIFVPTFANLDIADMNRLWNAGIMPLGLTSRYIKFDGNSGSPINYFLHDLAHALIYLRLDANKEQTKLNNKTMDNIRIASNYLFTQLDKYKMNEGFIEFNGGKTTRNEVEIILFQFQHERAVKVSSDRIEKDIETTSRMVSLIGYPIYEIAQVESRRTKEPIDPFLAFYKANATKESEQTALKWIQQQWIDSGVEQTQ